MRRLSIAIVGLLVLGLSTSRPPSEGDGTLCPTPTRITSPIDEARLLAAERENGCLDDQDQPPPASWPPGWKTAKMMGGDVPPVRVVSDPYPTLHSVVVDAERNKVFFSDPNRHAIWTYDRLAASTDRREVEPLAGIRGPATGMMFIAAVTLDREKQEIYTVDNDIGDRLMVFPYDADGNAKPTRVLDVPHQAWGISISDKHNEFAVTIEAPREIVIYRKGAEGHEAALRTIRGPRTRLGDPHGIFYDDTHDELVVSNHGNQGGRAPAPGDAPARQRGSRVAEPEAIEGGRFDEPSITVYPAGAKGDVAPLRQIQGDKTGLNWPMAVDVDLPRNEIAVANDGDSSIRIFRRTDSGNVAPVRMIRGARTLINGPMGVAFDPKNDEIWVANYGDHTALVFSITANGNVPPKRVIRDAPQGSPTVGFGNPGAVAYDSKRDEILVPN